MSTTAYRRHICASTWRAGRRSSSSTWSRTDTTPRCATTTRRPQRPDRATAEDRFTVHDCPVSRVAVLTVLMVVACAAPNQPSVVPSPTATGSPAGSASAPTTAGSSATPTAAASSAPPSATATASSVPPTSDPHVLAFDLFASGFGALTFVTNAGDGTGLLYAVEQTGAIRIANADGTALPDPFLDISDRVSSGGERGLLGLAFKPGYDDNGRLYVDYTNVDGNTVVSEFLRGDELHADVTTERVLFTVEQPAANHNGGMLAFGPDGALYVAMGDGGSGADSNGQNPDVLLGKLLRVDVDAAPGPAAEPQIWDSGLRNPWRFSFDRETGDVFIGD